MLKRGSLMAAPVDLAKLSAALERFQEKFSAALANLPDGSQRAQFAAYLEHMKTTQGQFLVEAQKLDQALDQQLQSTKDKVAAAKEQVAAAKAARQEQLALLAA